MALYIGVRSFKSQQLEIQLDQRVDLRWYPQMTYYKENKTGRLRYQNWGLVPHKTVHKGTKSAELVGNDC